MNDLSARNSSFSPQLEGLQLAVDSTSLGEFKQCPRKYQYSIIEGWEPRDTSVHLFFGLLVHEARELYEWKKIKGIDHEQALEEIVQTILEKTWEKDLQRGWISNHPQKTRLSLIRTVVWYLDQLAKDDPIETVIKSDGTPMVELSFRFDSGYKASTGEAFVICGHLDRVGKLSDTFYIPDIKTTGGQLGKFFFDSFTPNNQFSLYSFASKVVFGFEVKDLIVDGIQVGATFSRFQRAIIPRKQQTIDEWFEELGYWLKLMNLSASLGKWPQNDKACGMYGGCQFREVCSKVPSERERQLKASFSKRVWDPLQIRGDI